MAIGVANYYKINLYTCKKKSVSIRIIYTEFYLPYAKC